jgi:hypothetical protein
MDLRDEESDEEDDGTDLDERDKRSGVFLESARADEWERKGKP